MTAAAKTAVASIMKASARLYLIAVSWSATWPAPVEVEGASTSMGPARWRLVTVTMSRILLVTTVVDCSAGTIVYWTLTTATSSVIQP